MEEKKPDYVFLLVSAGSPQMYSHPIDGYGSPPDVFRQPLGWHSEKDGFGVRLFKFWKMYRFKDSQREVLLYLETTPNPTLCYRAMDLSYFEDGVWETPTERNAQTATSIDMDD